MLRIIHRHHSLFFTIFRFSIFVLSIHCENRLFSIILLSYFYYSSFTGWHESVHRDFSPRGLSFEKLNGMINMVPSLVLNYKEKLSQHIQHHTHTNDPENDPDYKTNNLILNNLNLNLNNKNIFQNKFSTLDFIEIALKIFFLLIIYKYWIINKDVIDFFLSYLMGNLTVHIIVNILPHYRNGLSYGRNFKSNIFINILLLGNNLHGLHHKYPNLSWLNLSQRKNA